ncbi:MAG: hypothetical protein ABSG93_19210 [Solirubrobacteraceae bacterium]|jgi:hypothetical protein
MAAETAEAPPETLQEPAAAAAPSAAPKKAAKSDAKAKDAKKGGKDAKAAKGKGKGKESADAGASGANGPSIAAHPRAARAVARAKSWGGLIGFMLAGYLALPTNTLAGAGLRALIAGIVCYLAAWAGAVFLWRRLVMLEIKGREAQIAAAHAARARRELPAGPPSAGAQG